ncbi:MCP four helix bundle domain-containing protein [Dactylosporangium sp. NPDC050588]|uniref:MCP four helix bundle domain-containing protein n=1 Tax=Dactylosporangium sp. NPDC050588 TaxID=3157211 RepID=UPI0033D8C058
MASFASLKVRHNIIIAVAVAGLVAAAVGEIGLNKISAVAKSADAMYSRALLPAADAADLREAVWQFRFFGVVSTTVADPAGRTRFAAERDAAAARIESAAATFAGRDLDAAQRAAIARFTTAWGEYTDILKQGQGLIAAGLAAVGQALLIQQGTPKAEDAVKDLVAVAEASRSAAQARRRGADHDPARLLLGGDRRRHQGHHVDRRADQPPGPQRHHRGRPRG